MTPAAERLVRLGNIEDDFDTIAEADWIVEAIIEKTGIPAASFRLFLINYVTGSS